MSDANKNNGKIWSMDTMCVQEGYKPENGAPRVVPITQSTTFKYETAEMMGDLFDLKSTGYFYTRLANPTAAAPEEKLAALEGGVGAVMTASGQSAITLSLLNIAKAGDHVISASAIYGGTFNLFNKTLREMGIDFTFVSPTASKDELDAAFRENTKLVFGETLTNPSLDILDIEVFAEAAHSHGVPLIVDNTFPTPVLCRPIEFGADIVVHSTSKYLDGHAVSLGGMIIDSGKFDWAASGKYPGLTEPDESYHGTVYARDFGSAAYIVKCRTHLMRDLGVSPAPMNAFLLNCGMETLHLRMKRHSENGQKIAEFLEAHEAVEWVKYSGLKSSPGYGLAQKYLRNGVSGVVSFGVRGGREAACRVLNNFRLAAIVTHVADLRTCALHPASTTHRQMSDKELEAAGVRPELIRFSVGIEDAEDIIADLEQALSKL